tara:strand:+ start:3175 stop:3441 length:267 start_codon:yes stop_codon:yes gene_type:complete
MSHPDVLRMYTINNFLFIFKRDCLEINGKDIKWEVTLYDDGVQWDTDKYITPVNVGVFMSPGSCKLEELSGTLFYEQIKEWMELEKKL